MRLRARQLVFLVFLVPGALVAWAACSGPTGGGQPDGGTRPGTRPAAPPTPPVVAPTPPMVEHEVAEGETLWDIARAYDTHVESIMRANSLRPEDVRRIGNGTKLKIPGAPMRVTVDTTVTRRTATPPRTEDLPTLTDGAYHVLGEGESIWDLARRYDKSADAIMERNELTDEDLHRLRPGQAIIIPGITRAQVRQPTRETRRNGIFHTMAPGETIWDLARVYSVSASEVMTANSLSEAEVTALRDGTRLFLPGVREERPGRVVRETSAGQARATQLARRLGLGTRAAAGELLHGRVRPAWLRAAGASKQLPGTLRWPVANGAFVRGYGSGTNAYHLAVDIRGEIGWNVRAAAPGIVGYAGNELRGFGNVVFVIHPGGWVTLYAHNSTNFVVAGQMVPRGGVLAELGSTGLSQGPHSHFEFIYDGKNCDPALLFRPGIRHRSGRVSPLPYTTWTSAAGKPTRVKCGRRIGHPASFWIINENPDRIEEPLHDLPGAGEEPVPPPADEPGDEGGEP